MKPIPQDYTEENIFNQQRRLQSGETLNKITWNFIPRTVTSCEELRRLCDTMRKMLAFAPRRLLPRDALAVASKSAYAISLGSGFIL